MKTKRTFLNSAASLLYYLVAIVLGIINRRAVLSYLGIEFQGIDGLFSNVLNMLAIAELGIGGVVTYQLYEPILNKDTATISSIQQGRCILL